MAAQIAQAKDLAAQRRQTNAGLQGALEKLQAISQKMSLALARLAQARASATEAEQVQSLSIQQLAVLKVTLNVQRDALGEWARSTYTMGGPIAAYEGWLVALKGRTSGEVAHNLSVLEGLGIAGASSIHRLQQQVEQQTSATDHALRAAAQAQAAREQADAAVTTLKGLKQQAQLASAQLRVQQAALVGKGQLTAQERANLAAAEAFIMASGAIGGSGSCTGLDTRAFANGMIPAAALCPVWGAVGQHLRADAASGLTGLSRAFAKDFGQPICVTDSYRSLAAQVKVYAAKPQLAARPGTSNHGRGIAVDLCGGIQSFGSEQHAWMLAHAPLHGWYHPAWAGPAGAKPEPWHWEYGG